MESKQKDPMTGKLEERLTKSKSVKDALGSLEGHPVRPLELTHIFYNLNREDAKLIKVYTDGQLFQVADDYVLHGQGECIAYLILG